VEPKENSNHLAGHALDMNVRTGGQLYNSKKLKVSNFATLPPNIQTFLNAIRNDSGLRWGGDFQDEDPVHIDDNLNSDMTSWRRRYDATQNARKSKCG